MRATPLGFLFVLIGLGLAGIAVLAARHQVVIAAAAAVLAVWMWSLAARVLRRRIDEVLANMQRTVDGIKQLAEAAT